MAPTIMPTIQALTDAIPLLDKDTTVGSPTNGQFVIGRNTAREIRTILLKSLLTPGAAGPYARPGVLPTVYSSSLGQYTDLKVSAQASANTTFTVKAGRSVVSKTGQGAYLAGLESDVASITPAVADSQSRYDVIYTRIYDGGGGDSPTGPNGPYLEYVKGDPSGAPVLATVIAAVPTDGMPLAAILRPGGNSVITDANITDLRKSTGLLGAVRPLMPGDAVTDAGLMVGELRSRRTPSALVALGAPAQLIEYWDTDSQWHLAGPIDLGSVAQTGSGSVAAGADLIVAALSIPDIGVPYRLQVSGSCGYSWVATGTVGALAGVIATIDSSVYNSGVLASGLGLTGTSVAANNQPTVHVASKNDPTVRTGAHTVRLIFHNYAGAAFSVGAAIADFRFTVSLLPA